MGTSAVEGAAVWSGMGVSVLSSGMGASNSGEDFSIVFRSSPELFVVRDPPEFMPPPGKELTELQAVEGFFSSLLARHRPSQPGAFAGVQASSQALQSRSYAELKRAGITAYFPVISKQKWADKAKFMARLRLVEAAVTKGLLGIENHVKLDDEVQYVRRTQCLDSRLVPGEKILTIQQQVARNHTSQVAGRVTGKNIKGRGKAGASKYGKDAYYVEFNDKFFFNEADSEAYYGLRSKAPRPLRWAEGYGAYYIEKWNVMPTERFFRFIMTRSDALLADVETAPYLIAQMRTLLHSSGFMSSANGSSATGSGVGPLGRFSQGTMSSHLKNKQSVSAGASNVGKSR